MNQSYQRHLAFLRESTHIVTRSWSMPYNGQTIYGARYNGTEVLTCHIAGRAIYSKSLKMMKGLIRKLGENEIIYRGVKMQITLSEDGDYLDEVVVNGIYIGHLISEFDCDEILEQYLEERNEK